MTQQHDRRDFLKSAALGGLGAAALAGWPGRAHAAGTVNWLARGSVPKAVGTPRLTGPAVAGQM